MQHTPRPQLLHSAEHIPIGGFWSFEPKFDGYRALIRIDRQGEVRVITRGGFDWTRKFPLLVARVKALRLPPATIDGEIVAMSSAGHTDFRELCSLVHRGEATCFVAFDILEWDGHPLHDFTLNHRR